MTTQEVMITPPDLADQFRAFCLSNGQPELVKKYARYFTEGYDAYGVPQALFELERDRLIGTYRDLLGLEGFLDLGDRLVRSGKYEEGSLAIVLLDPFQDQFTLQTFERLGKWLEEAITNWAHTDILSTMLLSPMLISGKVTLSALAVWRQSPSKWKRRAVPVSLIAPLKKADTCSPFLSLIDPMMMDEDRMVHQGLGWFLREAWKIFPDSTETFLLKWKDAAARKIYQYATEKMSAEQKARFRAEKRAKRRD